MHAPQLQRLHDEEEAEDAAAAAAQSMPSKPTSNLSHDHAVDAFTPLGTLGRGNMGTVFLVLSNSTPFALKITRSLSNSKKQRSHIERDILSSLHHPFLQTLHAHFELRNHSLFLLDFCSGGDLNLLRHRQPEKRFSETAARFYAAEVLVALEHLHKLGIVYRDLKPENILVQGSGHIKLTDFDLSLNLGAGIQAIADERAPDKRLPLVRTLQQQIIAEANLEKVKQGLHLHGGVVLSCSKGCIAKDLEEGDLVSVDRDLEAECNILRTKKDAKQTCNFCRLQCLGLNGKVCLRRRKKGSTDQHGGLSRESLCLGASKKKKVNYRVEKPCTQSCFPRLKSKDCKDAEERYVCVVGTDEYVAPEVLRGEEHGFSMDWWSFGVLLYEMIYGHTPFKGASSERTLFNILEKEAEFPGMKTPVKHLIAQLLVKYPAARLGAVGGARDIKQHPFFCGVNWDSLPYIYRPPFIPPPLCLSELEESYSAKQKAKREGTHEQKEVSGISKSWLDEVVEIIEAADNAERASSQYSRSSSSAGFPSSSADGADRELRRDDDVDALFSSAEWSRELEAGKHTPSLM